MTRKTNEILNRVGEFSDKGLDRAKAVSTLRAQYLFTSLLDAAQHLGAREIEPVDVPQFIVNTIYNASAERERKTTMGKMLKLVRECEKLPDTNRYVPYGSNLEFDDVMGGL